MPATEKKPITKEPATKEFDENLSRPVEQPTPVPETHGDTDGDKKTGMTKDELIESIKQEINKREEVIASKNQQIEILLKERATMADKIARLSAALSASSSVLSSSTSELADVAANDAKEFSASIRRNQN